MNAARQIQADVIVVGAGPVGLALALSLLARGREVTLVDKRQDEDNTSRAAVVYPGTLELLDAYGVAERLAASGIRTPQFTIRDRDRILMAVPFSRLATPFPFALLVSQATTEAQLRKAFERSGGRILGGREVREVAQTDGGVTVQFACGEPMHARFLVGADGVHSVVRQRSGIPYEGTAAGESYSLADVHLTGGVPGDELVVYFSSAGHMVVLPLPGGIHRIVVHVKDAPELPTVEFLQEVLDARGPEAERAVIRDVVWGSRFMTRHALAARYRAGRVLLAGDAAHEHSPLGGQGMNLGIHDAIALGRALSNVLEGDSPDLLDSYAATQRPMAQEVISTTDLLTNIATMNEPMSEIRNVLVHVLDPMIRKRLAWRLSLLGYRDATLGKMTAA
jgi:2-polyprenyl-6-methoxyphenol hydroxylase-like FAD-dependent oxidoreductase